MLSINRFIFNPIQENTYVVSAPSGESAIVDPGNMDSRETEALLSLVSERGLSVRAIWLTHMHFDHVWGVKELLGGFNVPVMASAEDLFLMEHNSDMTSAWGLPPVESFGVTDLVAEGDELVLGDEKFAVIEVPGHTPGGLAFYDKAEGVCFTGDSLFKGSIGRTDFPGGNEEDLLQGIRGKLLTLPEETIILPGHGPQTTVRAERLSFAYGL